MTPLEETTFQQIIAADPARSAFVLANAGSGKTRVLTNRVARLLAAGFDPQKILCITFTKAAAVEMTSRLFALLGEWAFFDDQELQDAFRELEGEDYRLRSANELSKIRVLFAKALETPGGLKIQTIHSFCEYVLKTFPLEAGVPPGFTVLEEGEASVILDACIDKLSADGDGDFVEALRRLSPLLNETDFRALLRKSVSNALNNGKASQTNSLADALGVNAGLTPHDVKAPILKTIERTDIERAHDALFQSGGNPKKLAVHTTAYLKSTDDKNKWHALEALLLIKSNTKPRDTLATNATDKVDPWARGYLTELKERFWKSVEKLRILKIIHDTIAFETLSRTLKNAYATQKASRAYLDFDDLIEATLYLLSKEKNTWIMYKLDNGIDHILIDEAQDTSPQQWAIVENLLGDYLSGQGAKSDTRSFFAVGDMKQSIYGFQGADAKLFEAKEATIGSRLRNVTEYVNATLAMSFRSTEPILNFVDTLFTPPEIAAGLGDGKIPVHLSNRQGDAGLVEIWPLVPRPETQNVNAWDAPVDSLGDTHPTKVLSNHVADQIADWIGRKKLESKNRTIEPNDILILVQTRGQLFNDVIRQLANKQVAVAGADRLKLLEDPAIEDMLSFARFATYDHDDLSLAEILKSPLYNFTDDDLFAVAYNRGKGISLWQSLQAKRHENVSWECAYDEIETAKILGLRDGPFAFFSHILERGEISGRKRFFGRLTEASKDSLGEIVRQTLAFERKFPRSLKLFVDWFERNAGEIKREMEDANNAVRVMTVHGAKGLEAPVVILLDAHRRPATNKNGRVFDLNARSGLDAEPINALVCGTDNHIEQTARARDEIKRTNFEEYRRLLYVAATRARDQLYICGIEQGNNTKPREAAPNERSWHSLALDAFENMGDHAEELPAPSWARANDVVLRISTKQQEPVEKNATVREPTAHDIPTWLHEPVPREMATRQITPSHLADEIEAYDRAPSDAPYSPTKGDVYFRGRIIHRLLELLPDLPVAERNAGAIKLLEKLAPALSEDERHEWANEVIAVLNNDKFSAVFAKGSRAEVAIAGKPKNVSADIFVNGQVDRLVISEKTILAIDYKTNRPPPKKIEDAPIAYIAQMAAYRALLQEIYPGHEISLGLLWTFEPHLMEIPNAMLDHAFERHVLPG